MNLTGLANAPIINNLYRILNLSPCKELRSMPVVIVEMWEGRSTEQKERLIKGITRAFEEIGVKAEWLNIIIHDIPKDNWGTRGEQASKLAP